MSRSKYKDTIDLYTEGREVFLTDDLVVYLRALNPLERQKALAAAQAARGRLHMALREVDSDEQSRVRGVFFEDGREAAVTSLLQGQMSEMISRIASEVRDEKEWKEKLEIMDRSEDLRAREPEDIERRLLERIEQEWLDEVNVRYENERESVKMQYEAMSEEALLDEVLEAWSTQLAQDAADEEFRLTEMWLAVRACEGVFEGGDWDHSKCENHRLQLYETKDEVAKLPDALMELYAGELAALNVSVRDAKNSDRLRSFSGSSPQPSEVEDSTPSTPEETPSDAPGISTPPSSTP